MSKTQQRLERLIAVPPERVFAFWINPEQIVRWWGPEGYEIPGSSFDVRPGGKWSTMVQTPDGQRRTVSGIYRANIAHWPSNFHATDLGGLARAR